MDDLSLRLTVPMRERTLEVEASVSAASPLAIVGPSGAGKSTLLRAIAGLATPSAGRIASGGRVLFDHAARTNMPVEQREVGLVFQEYFLFPHLSVRGNVAFGARCGEAGIDELLRRMRISHLAGARPRAISGGERQRVALARALAMNPRVLLLDEPVSALDAALRTDVLVDLAAVMRTCGAPSIAVTHSFQDAALLADNVLVIVDGVVVQRGTPTQLLARPEHPFVANLAGMNVLSGTATANARHGLTHVRLAADFGGGEIWSTDTASGPVSVLIAPADITIGQYAPDASALNHLPGTIASAVPVGNRMRVQVAPLASVDITSDSWTRMGLETGRVVTVSFKATSVQLLSGHS